MADDNLSLKMKALVVDDEPDVRSLIEVLLASSGYSVITASDGQQALEKARVEHPDIILLDVMLPKLDGYKVARMLKFDENFKHIPIIMLTAKVTDRDKEMGIETGADIYLTKPFEAENLLAAMERALQKYQKNHDH
ncbi:MAG: response regulator [Candidatus Margulisbacteria bacterium]|nr:response regulator [Candidatus Margulisiibacteriota bacterium]MBU1617760.1 response regulator [Candidatus Margulisiibacteriota bacterium]MBU1867791.1 response regulator [Candidatus Margulisiibacteriota bacterium]